MAGRRAAPRPAGPGRARRGRRSGPRRTPRPRAAGRWRSDGGCARARSLSKAAGYRLGRPAPIRKCRSLRYREGWLSGLSGWVYFDVHGRDVTHDQEAGRADPGLARTVPALVPGAGGLHAPGGPAPHRARLPRHRRPGIVPPPARLPGQDHAPGVHGRRAQGHVRRAVAARQGGPADLRRRPPQPARGRPAPAPRARLPGHRLRGRWCARHRPAVLVDRDRAARPSGRPGRPAPRARPGGHGPPAQAAAGRRAPGGHRRAAGHRPGPGPADAAAAPRRAAAAGGGRDHGRQPHRHPPLPAPLRRRQGGGRGRGGAPAARRRPGPRARVPSPTPTATGTSAPRGRWPGPATRRGSCSTTAPTRRRPATPCGSRACGSTRPPALAASP